MKNNKTLLILIVVAVLVGAYTAFLYYNKHKDPQADYAQADERNAIILCMTAEYVKYYEQDLPDNDIMPVCRARWQTVQQTIPFEKYKQVMLDTPFQRDEPEETAAVRKTYNDILSGVPQTE